MSIAAVANVYNDAKALRGMLESASSYFDEIFIIHTGPQGQYSTDGTIELCQQFGVKLYFDQIDKGYGVIRSRLIHEHGCEWAMILDADERFYPDMPVLRCTGIGQWDLKSSSPIEGLEVSKSPEHTSQGFLLKELIGWDDLMAIRSVRRHWMDFSMKHPTQNWEMIPDYQLRIIRNVPEINYVSEVKMHERVIDSRTGTEPQFWANGDPHQTIFHDHFHPWFRLRYPGSKEFNEANYQRLERGETLITNEQSNPRIHEYGC